MEVLAIMTEEIDSKDAVENHEASEEELGQATGIALRESDNDVAETEREEAYDLREGSPLAEFLRPHI
jgi:hypothetical protein